MQQIMRSSTPITEQTIQHSLVAPLFQGFPSPLSIPIMGQTQDGADDCADVPNDESTAKSCDEVFESVSTKLSRGSAEHSSGSCRPCAWFWKAQGCSNGEDCGFCHLCPREEIKQRRRTKTLALRSNTAASSAAPPPNTAAIPQQSKSLRATMLRGMPLPPVLPAPKLFPSVLLPPLPESDATTTEQQLSDGIDSETQSEENCPSDDCSLNNFAGDARCFSAPVTPRTVHARVPLPPPPSPATLQDRCMCPAPAIAATSGLLPLIVPSVGSQKHGSGQCKPCSWFWKPAGCANGSECGHCHLCPEGEIRFRRKAKFAVIQAQKEKISKSGSNDTHKGGEQPCRGTDANQPGLPTLLGRLRPAQLNECVASSRVVDDEPRKSTTMRLSPHILRLSDCV